ncbi:MAG: tetratricopeptide repeat protein [bacterium]
MKLTKSFTICVSLVVFVGCSSRTERVNKYLVKGDHLAAEGDTARAILEYKSALQLDPKNIRVRLSLGKCYGTQARYSESYRQFMIALELNPESDEARLEIAALLARGNKTQAQRALDELAQLKAPKDYEPRYSIIQAESYLNLGQPKDAITILSPLGDGDKDKDIQRLLAFCFRQLRDFEKMKNAARTWQALAPSEIPPYILMARYFYQAKDKEGVLKELDAMVKSNGNQGQLTLLRARILEDFGMIKEAKAAFEVLPPELLRERAHFFLRHGEEEKAEETFRQVLSDQPENIDIVIELSQLLRSRQRLNSARDLLDKTMALSLSDSDKERIFQEKAILYAFQGKLRDAHDMCTKILKGNQSNVDARFLLGKILFRLGELEQAELNLNQVAVARPELSEAHVLLARCQLANKKNSLAEETLQKVLRLHPSDPMLRMELVDFYMHLKNSPRALKVLEDGLTLKPDDVGFLVKRGAIRRAEKNYPEAEKDFQYLIQVHPSSFTGYIEMGRLRYMQARPDEAITWFKQAMTKKDGLEQALEALLGIYHERKEFDTAATLLKSLLKDAPDTPSLHYYLGMTYMVQELWEKGEKELLAASTLAPQWSSPYIALAKMYIKQGKLNKAVDEFEQTYQRQPTLPVGLQLAALYESCGNWKDGIKVYQQMLERNGDIPILLNNLAFSYAEYYSEKERLKEAARMAAQSLSIKPGNPTYLDTAAWVAYKQGKLDTAWDYIQKALDISPNEGICNLHAAIILHEKGDAKEALQYLEKAMKYQLDPLFRDKAVLLQKQWSNKQGRKS